jgi:c-di-GMP-binding flagellar brake protein YcgR
MDERMQSSSSASQGTGHEQRRSVRYSCVLDASCWTSDAVEFNTSVSAVVLNISRGGMALLIGQHFEPGTILTVGLDSTTQDFLPPLKARVVHAQQRPNGDWVLGCAFVRPLTDEDLQALLA